MLSRNSYSAPHSIYSCRGYILYYDTAAAAAVSSLPGSRRRYPTLVEQVGGVEQAADRADEGAEHADDQA